MDADNILSSFQFSDVEFPLFQKLSPELGNAIWTWALPRPRMITIPHPSYEEYLGQDIDLGAPSVFEFFSDAVPIPCRVFYAFLGVAHQSPQPLLCSLRRSHRKPHVHQLAIRYPVSRYI
jgi:hypothetical protein